MKRVFPSLSGGIRFLINFHLFWKMCLDMIKAGSGFQFNHEILTPGTDIRTRTSITDIVDIAMLPKAIGGDAVSVDEDGKEDETYTRGLRFPTLSAFLEGLGE